MNSFKKGDAVFFEYEVKEIEGGTQNVLTKIGKADLNGGGGSPANPGQASALPTEKDFTLQLEGDEEVRTAKLAEGNGFALYVFDFFTFDPERGLLSMNRLRNQPDAGRSIFPADRQQRQADAGSDLEGSGRHRLQN